MEFIERVGLVVVIALIVIHHLIDILDRFFGAPEFIVRTLRRHRAAEVRVILAELGIDDYERANLSAGRLRARIARAGRYTDAQKRCVLLLRSCTRDQNVHVGTSETIEFPYFVDLMSASLQPGRAIESAHIISSHMKNEPVSSTYDFDYIIGLKGGSPLIAAAFAEMVKRPLILFRGPDRYKINPSIPDAQNLFDGSLARNKVGVVVDDSTTGGKMVLDCILAARDAGVDIRQCWVLFEPLGKQAREKLKGQGVELVSVVKMTADVIAEIRKGK